MSSATIKRFINIHLFLGLGIFLMHGQTTDIDSLLIMKGDSVEFSFPEYRGTMYYETSYDLIHWQIDTEPISNYKKLYPDTTLFYRLVILEGTCDPVWSDTSFVRVVHKPVVMIWKTDVITQISAHVYGIIPDDGELTLVNKGACWDSLPNPTIEKTFLISAMGSDTFLCVLEGLTPGSTYYVRAFARNDSGLSYSNETQFTTLTDSNLPVVQTLTVEYISPHSANAEAEVISDGGNTVFDRGFCLDTVTGPDTNDITIHSGSGTGKYNSFMSGLLPGSTYYIRAFAENNAGISYGDELSFDTEEILTLPVVVTHAVDSFNCHEVFVSASVIDDGNDSILLRGVCWDTLALPTIDDNTTTDGPGLGSYISHIDNLDGATTYYLRAYAINHVGVAYGEVLEVTTAICLYPPEVLTMGVSEITSTTAILEGKVINDGNNFVSERGFCWDTLPNPGYSGNRLVAGADTGYFEDSLTQLKVFKNYYFRAYAINQVDTAYGNEISFRTLNITDSLWDERDGQAYEIVLIGDQWWMAENLNYYTVTNSYYYNDDSLSNADSYGRLYIWDTANRVCPSGWHLPTDVEWKEFEMYLGMTQEQADLEGYRGTDQGTQLKEGGISGFNAKLGGRRTSGGSYVGMGAFGYYWTSTSTGNTSADAYYRSFSLSEPTVGRLQYAKKGAFYVRCLKD